MFVTFKLIKFINYKGVKNSSLVLDERGVLLIKGVNNDKTGSNGAGKSTISNGLLWCLYGQTLTGKETEAEIIPKFISKTKFKKEGCRVVITVMREDIEYRITRHRKHPQFKNTVVLEKKIGDVYDDKSRCVDGETNDKIVEIIGADFDSFVHSNVFSFNNVKPFLERSDTDKKELILPTFFIEKFRAAYKNTTAKIKAVNFELQDLNEADIAATVEFTEKNQQLEFIKRGIEEHTKQVNEVKLTIHGERDKQDELSLKVPVAQTVKQNIQITLKNLAEKSDQIEKSIKKCHDNQAIYNQLLNDKLSLEAVLSNAKLSLEQLKNTSGDIHVTKLAELNGEVQLNTNEYTRFDTEIKRIEAIILQKENLLSNILNTKSNIVIKIQAENMKLTTLSQNIVQTESVIGQLNSQHGNVTDKYFSKECLICPHSKYMEVLKDIEESTRLQELSLILFKGDYDNLADVIKGLETKKLEVEGFEKTISDEINVIKAGELTQYRNKALIMSNKLHDLKNAVIEVQSYVTDSQVVIENISNIQKIIDDCGLKLKAVKKSIKDFGDVTGLQQELEKCKKKLNVTKSDITAQKMKEIEAIKVICELDYNIKAIDDKVKALSVHLVEPIDLNTQKSNLDSAIAGLRNRKSDIKNRKEIKRKELEILNFWKIGFSSAGVEGFMLDTILNNMNVLVAKYLGYLSNNTISLTLLPDSNLKSGETRNKISEKVENDSGGPTYRGNSSGEKRIMDIAILFALKYIYEQITKTRYNLVFMDEVFDSLDASTCSLVITLLYSMSDINSIFVVSHSEAIAVEFDSYITAIKTRGITEIV